MRYTNLLLPLPSPLTANATNFTVRRPKNSKFLNQLQTSSELAPSAKSHCAFDWDSSNSARCSGRTKTKVMGDDTEVPKAPRLRCRVLHGVHNRSGGNPPVPPVIRALARWATVVEQCQIRCWPVASMRHHCLLCWQGTRTFVGLVVLQHPMEPGMN